MKSILEMNDLAVAVKKLSSAEMSVISGGSGYVFRGDGFCGTPVPRPSLPFPWPTGPIVVGPIIVPSDWPLPHY